MPPTEVMFGLAPSYGIQTARAAHDWFLMMMQNTPLTDLSEMGGWRNAKTILKCYQWPDTETQREALRNRKPILKANIRL